MTWELVGDDSGIVVMRNGAAARITFDRPHRRNALDQAAAVRLRDVLHELGSDDAVRAVLLTGAPGAFCSGADITGSFRDTADREKVEQSMHEVTTPTVLALREMPKPVVTAVNGAAAGMGCSLALACDLVLAGASSYFLLAFANLGLTVDAGASLTVPARVGVGRAFVMALLAERTPAADAVAWGLADRLVADDELEATAEQLVLRLAGGPTRSYAATKALVNRAQLAGLAEQLGREADEQGALLRSSDFAGAVEAFGAKRSPTFEGR